MFMDPQKADLSVWFWVEFLDGWQWTTANIYPFIAYEQFRHLVLVQQGLVHRGKEGFLQIQRLNRQRKMDQFLIRSQSFVGLRV